MEGFTFGKFLTAKRLEHDMTLRGFAGILGLSPVYICNLEKDKRPVPRKEILGRIIAILCLSETETEMLLDLAAKSQGLPAVSYDISAYIMEKEIVRTALRAARDAEVTDEDWQGFIERVK